MTTMLMSTRHPQANIKRMLSDMSYLANVEIEPNFSLRKSLGMVESLMDVNDCESIMFFEITKRFQRIWFASSKISIRFDVIEMLSIFELSSPVNCHKEGGHVLCFSKEFDESPNLAEIKKLFSEVFHNEKATERALCFFTDGTSIFIRNYVIDGMAEIGPRFDLKINKILQGCFKGECIYNSRATDSTAADSEIPPEKQSIEVESNSISASERDNQQNAN